MFHALGLSQKCKFIDLGSGDGRIVFLAATKMKWQSTGVEIHPLLVFFSRLINLIFFKTSARFVHQNIFKHDLSPYQIVYFYVQPAMFTKLITKILSECKPGTIIVSARFKLPHLKLIKTIDNVYAYRI